MQDYVIIMYVYTLLLYFVQHCNPPHYVLRHQRELVGFVNLGEMNNHLIQFEQQVEGNTSEYEP